MFQQAFHQKDIEMKNNNRKIYLSLTITIRTLNVNGLNTSIRKQDCHIKTQIHTASKKHTS